MRYAIYSIKLLAVWAVLLALFAGLSYATNHLRNDTLRANAISSLTLLDEEGTYPRFKIGGQFLQKDNYTDAIMIGASVCRSDTLNAFEDALLVPIYTFSRDNDDSPASGALRSISGGGAADYTAYGRYWHGYLTFLRPLLMLTDLSGIRILNIIILYLLTAINCLILWKKFGKTVCLLFLVSLLSVGLATVPLSLQFSTCFIIMSVSVMIFSCIPKRMLKTSSVGIGFFIIGALTSYFDLLTTPLITLGMPLSVVLLRRRHMPDIRAALFSGVMWCAGYVILWGSKWILAEMFTSFPMLNDALQNVAYRAAGVSASDGLARAFRLLVYGVIALAVCFYLSIRAIKAIKPSNQMKKYYTFAIIAWLPFVWIFSFQNHSLWHNWFVWRILMVFLFNISLFYYLSLKNR